VPSLLLVAMIVATLTAICALSWETVLNPEGLAKPYGHIYLRAFKRECEMEVWAAPGQSMKYRRLAVLPIAALSGRLGPKRREGDKQVPEGLYRVVKFNPDSAYTLSMGLDYPNQSDAVRSDKTKPGGEIFIHGKAVSAGCLAMGDDGIRKLYGFCKMAVYTDDIEVHIFPTRMTEDRLQVLKPYATGEDLKLWAELKPVFTEFNRNHRMPVVTIQPDGAYKVVSFGL